MMGKNYLFVIETYDNLFCKMNLLFFCSTVRLWDMESAKRKHHAIIKTKTQQGVKAAATTCAYSRDGKYVAAGCNDGSIQMWQHGKLYVSPICWPLYLYFCAFFVCFCTFFRWIQHWCVETRTALELKLVVYRFLTTIIIYFREVVIIFMFFFCCFLF